MRPGPENIQRIRKTALFLLLPIAFYLFTGCSADPARKEYEKAEELLSKGEYSDALERYYRISSSFQGSPYGAKSQYRIAFIYNNHFNDKKRAVAAYYAVYYIYPKSPEAVLAGKDLAKIYSDAGDHVRALEQYQRLMKQRPEESAEFKRKIALEYLYMGDFRQSRIEFNELLKSAAGKDSVAEVRFQIANTYYLEGDTEKAIYGYDEVISGFPETPAAKEAAFNKAKAFEETGHSVEALGILRSIRPDYPNKGAIDLKIEAIEKRLKEVTE